MYISFYNTFINFNFWNFIQKGRWINSVSVFKYLEDIRNYRMNNIEVSREMSSNWRRRKVVNLFMGRKNNSYSALCSQKRWHGGGAIFLSLCETLVNLQTNDFHITYAVTQYRTIYSWRYLTETLPDGKLIQ